MKLLLDENIESWLRDHLATSHEIAWDGRDIPLSSPDGPNPGGSGRSEFAVLTRLTDFGVLVFRDARAHQGVVLLRLGRLSRSAQIALIDQALAMASEAPGRFLVVTPSGSRTTL